MSRDCSLARWNRAAAVADKSMREEYTAGLVSAKPRPNFAAAVRNKVVAVGWAKRNAPPPWGKRGGAFITFVLFYFLLFEGKRKLKRLILDGDAQHQFAGDFYHVRTTRRRHNFVIRFDGCWFECQGQDLPGCIVESLFALHAHGIFFRVLLMLNDVVRSRSQTALRRICSRRCWRWPIRADDVVCAGAFMKVPRWLRSRELDVSYFSCQLRGILIEERFFHGHLRRQG